MSEHKFTTFDPNADFFNIMYDNGIDNDPGDDPIKAPER